MLFGMDVRPRIALIEPALKQRHISVAQLCRKADLAATTWVRWKSGMPAQGRSWMRVLEALEGIDPALRSLAEEPAAGAGAAA
jgi:hypothetical protein